MKPRNPEKRRLEEREPKVLSGGSLPVEVMGRLVDYKRDRGLDDESCLP